MGGGEEKKACLVTSYYVCNVCIYVSMYVSMYESIKAVRYSTRVSRYTSQACIVYRLGKPNIVSCIG